MKKDDGIALIVIFGIAWWVSRRATVTSHFSYPGLDDNPQQNPTSTAPDPGFTTPAMNLDDPSTWGIDFSGPDDLYQEQSE